MKIQTPFAEVEIIIKDKDMWVKDEIMDWIYEKFGIPSPKQIERAIQSFDKKRMLMVL